MSASPITTPNSSRNVARYLILKVNVEKSAPKQRVAEAVTKPSTGELEEDASFFQYMYLPHLTNTSSLIVGSS